ncbi:AAA family ATPase [Sphingomonas bacterium]|uniref:AAA family ATPase n=1 Tax=Sphingomonas bacterium TaxID=1895847 RepID=UPI001575C3D5|nr:AAA family ATPase [Sphingomonas bacterium]
MLTSFSAISAVPEPPQSSAKIAVSSLFLDPPPVDPLVEFGLIPTGEGEYLLPPSVIMLQANGEHTHAALIEMLKTMGVPSHFALVKGDRRLALYRLDNPALISPLRRAVPDGVDLISEGEKVDLSGVDLSEGLAKNVAELSVLAAAHVNQLTTSAPEPAASSNALVPFSLRGQADKFKRLAIEAKPLLGDVCLKGQVTIWYAGPGIGKTLLALSLVVDAVREGRIAAGNVFFVNADDNGSGFATKLQIMDDLGAHTLSPGFRNLRNSVLIALLHKLADDDDARGVLVIVDTIKKFGSLMDKKESSAIAQAFRQVAMRGGSVLGLAHTTKNANADGTARYAGTSDLVDDADAVYTISKLSTSTEEKEKVVEFRRVKARGDSAERAAYAYAGETGVPYDELLASVRLIDPQQIDEFKRVEEQRSDADLITVASACITEGINTKMILAKEIASRTGISGREGGRLIDRYTGDDPLQHRWQFKRGGRGAFIYELLPLLPPGDLAPT